MGWPTLVSSANRALAFSLSAFLILGTGKSCLAQLTDVNNGTLIVGWFSDGPGRPKAAHLHPERSHYRLCNVETARWIEFDENWHRFNEDSTACLERSENDTDVDTRGPFFSVSSTIRSMGSSKTVACGYDVSWDNINSILPSQFCQALAVALFGDSGRSTVASIEFQRYLDSEEIGDFDVILGSPTNLIEDSTNSVYLSPPVYRLFADWSSGISSLASLEGARVCLVSEQQGISYVSEQLTRHNAEVVYLTAYSEDDIINESREYRCDGVVSRNYIISGASISSRLSPIHDFVYANWLNARTPPGDDIWRNVVEYTAYAFALAQALDMNAGSIEDLDLSTASAPVRNILGEDTLFLEMTGLDPDWARRAIRSVDNWDMIFKINATSPLFTPIPQSVEFPNLYTGSGPSDR
ncbi:MAG: hypothetical protein RIM33_10095 [Alphaproteobacteria bacterium]